MSPMDSPDEPNAEEVAGLPLYLQVASTLRTAILRGVYPVGLRMPTEEELCGRFKVSRHTIREALRQLRADGLIASRPGERPTVAPPRLPRREEHIGAAIGPDFFDYVIGTRLAIETMEKEPISRAVAAETGLIEGEEWLAVKGYRTGIEDGRLTCWNEYAIAPSHAMAGRLLKRHVGPLIPLLEDLFDQRITRITRATRAVGMPALQADRFRVAPGSPTLEIMACCQIESGTTVMIHRSLHPSGTITYAIQR